MRVRLYNIRTGDTIGVMDDATGEPRSDVPTVDQLLAAGSLGADRAERFRAYASGWSNGYVATEVEG